MKTVRSYVIWAYLVFWLSVLGLCGTASMVFHASAVAMRILSNVCAWTPTFVLLIGFRKFVGTSTTRKAFIKENFSGRLKPLLLILPCVLVCMATLLSVFATSLITKKSFGDFWSLGTYPFWASVLFSITTGPTGEELGWRGFLRPRLNERYGFVKGSVVQGVIWAFWHTVLWFVDSEFFGWTMIPYIVSNVLVMTSLALLMNYVLEKQRNLVYAILIHFSFNFLYCFLQVGIAYYIVMIFVFAVLGVGVLFCHNKDKARKMQ